MNRACHALLTDPELQPLVLWWELGLANALVPPGPVDPLRLAMAQGDRERLLGIRVRAAAHQSSQGNGEG